MTAVSVLSVQRAHTGRQRGHRGLRQTDPTGRRVARRLTAVLLTAAALGASACGTDDSAPGQITITMQDDLRFSPREATVAVGQRIEWRNDEDAPHNVTATTGADFRSQTITHDRTFTFTAPQPGTIRYHCSLHPGMTGTLRVTAP